ncbi:MAG: sugar phosphate isomerase/epimerase family protein [Anaerolineae bacterium]|nr:sugar phosphate isomerase/epimerase family protein [Anaerolineae bacterium]
MIRHSVMIGLLGRFADRFHEYQPARSLAERLAMVRQIEGADGIEPVYPAEFLERAEGLRLIRESGLAVSAINVNVKAEAKWRHGSFTSPDPAVRAEAVQYLKTGMDLAAELGADLVTCCPLIDGHNYPFQVDYLEQWRWLVEGVREAARHRSDVRVSLEYKLNEARNYIVLGDMGRALHLCDQVGLANVGVTLDVGHALLAKETPAAMVCLAAEAGRLFYVHFNDNGREWDWDMIPASVNLWDVIETLYYLERLGWQGWFSYDVVNRDSDPVRTLQAALRVMRAAEKLLDRLGRAELAGLIRAGDPAQTMEHLMGRLAE